MIKKWISVPLALAITMLGLASCQASNAGSATTALQTTAQNGSTAATGSGSETQEDGPLTPFAETVQLTTSRTIDAVAQFDENDPDKKSYEENRWITAYKDKLNVELTYKWIATDGDSNSTKWSTAIASGDIPDMGIVDNKVYQQLLDSGLIADMTDLYANYASDYYKELCDAQNATDYLTFDGKLYGLPYPSKGYHGNSILWIRKDWLDQLNLEVPKTLDDVRNIAQQFTENKLGGDNTIGLLFSSNMTSSDGNWVGYANGMGAYLDITLLKDDELVYSNAQPEIETMLLSMQELYNKGVINKDFSVATDETISKYIANGQAGMWYGQGWSPALGGLTGLYQSDADADVIPIYPVSESGEKVQIQSNKPVPGKCFVSAKCENPLAAIKVMNLTAQLDKDDPDDYSYGADGYSWFKLLPWGDRMADVFDDTLPAAETRDAVTSGQETFTTNAIKARYEVYKESLTTIKADDLTQRNPKWPLIYGYETDDGTYQDGSYCILYDAYQDGLLFGDAYTSLPTKTDSLKGSVLTDNLHAAMAKVVLGADISVFQEALEKWKSDGGDQIMQERNEVYQANKK